MSLTQNIFDTFPILTPGMEVKPLPWTGGMEFYEGLETHFGDFHNHVLISCHEFDGPWDTWECHPNGDEIVVLLSGSATLDLLIDGQHHISQVNTAGEFVIVPRGAWHKATEANNARMLFITPGEGTENRATPGHS
jgi:mannose-6-phosphate isomerase-like protein (cupin superfamily)